MTPTSSHSNNGRILNALTVDVEDWLQSTVDTALPLTDHFHGNTHRVLEAFAKRDVRGTFFVLGLAAEKAPGLIREIQQAGHEIQSHGYGHELLHTITPEHFRADVDRSKKLLEDITGEPIVGYRAPAFSITRRTLWALDVLVECGFQYDSSICPVKTKRYGIAGAPRYPHRLRTPAGYTIVELPIATYQVGGRLLAMGGGGYIRLFPYGVIRRAVRQINRAQWAAAIYMHPYEYNPGELRKLDYPLSWKLRLHQGLGRRRFRHKVDRLLREFRFGSMGAVIDLTEDLPEHEHSPDAD